MRTTLVTAFVLGAIALAGEARAEDAPTFAKLPVGSLTVPPKKRAAWVGAGEKVPGLLVERAPFGDGGLAAPVTVTTAARTGRPTSICVSEGERTFDADDPRAGEWQENLANETHAFPRSAQNPTGGVTAIHTERVVERDGAAVLETTDVWVDPHTRGARLIAKHDFPLALVHVPGFGVKVYAARDERSDGKRLVQFVVVRPVDETANVTTQAWAMRFDGDVVHSNACGHQRVAVAIDPANGDGATVIANVRLPDRGKMSKGEMRVRPLRVQVSVSQTSTEKEPLVSVSSGWAGREQMERAFPDEGD